MLTPIEINAFKKPLLNGDGSFEAATDQDVRKSLYESGRSFLNDIDKLRRFVSAAISPK